MSAGAEERLPRNCDVAGGADRPAGPAHAQYHRLHAPQDPGKFIHYVRLTASSIYVLNQIFAMTVFNPFFSTVEHLFYLTQVIGIRSSSIPITAFNDRLPDKLIK